MKYQGHKNWNHWNVALWIMNDERLYMMMRRLLRRSMSKDSVARALLAELDTHTPDGAPYTLSSVRAALVGE